MTNNLESRIEELKEQAKRRNIGQKAYLVSTELGIPQSFAGVGAGARSRKKFTSGKLKVSFGWDCDVFVSYNGETVFYQDSKYELKCYKPGYWERLITEFYKQAQEASRVRETNEAREVKETNDRKLTEEAKRFGL